MQFERNPDAVHAELARRLEFDLGFIPRDEKRRSDFTRIHLLPRNGSEVPDELETRLVVLDTGDHCLGVGSVTNRLQICGGRPWIERCLIGTLHRVTQFK